MFVTLLLAAGAARARARGARVRAARARAGLAQRAAGREDRAGRGCARSLVDAAACSRGLALFVGLDWSRVPLWLAALAARRARRSRRSGMALGALAREVRAASLLAFLLALPLAFLALVPSGAVSARRSTTCSTSISGAFPFKPALRALDAASTAATSLLPLAAPARRWPLAYGAARARWRSAGSKL